MFKQIFSTLAVLCLVLSSTLAQAQVDLGSMFSSLTTGNGNMSTTEAAGVYKSAAQTVYSAGGYDLHTPVPQRISLFSITAPTLTYGCSGISAHFGGFSFITGAEIQKFIKNIIQGAPGLVLQLAIKALCPQCEAVLQVMQTLAQRAAQFAANSCTAAKDMEKWAESSLPSNNTATNTAPQTCGVNVANNGGSIDMLGALNSVCTTTVNSVNALTASITGTPGLTPAQGALAAQQQQSMQGYIGNQTWQALKTLHYDPTNLQDRKTMVLLMNLVGTTIQNPVAAAASTNTSQPAGTSTATSTTASTGTSASPGTSTANLPADPTIVSTIASLGSLLTATGPQGGAVAAIVPKKMTVDSLYQLFMCGTPSSEVTDTSDPIVSPAYQATAVVTEYCRDYVSVDWSTATVMECNDDYDQCLQLGEVPLSASSTVQGPGILAQVNSLLRYGVQLVQTNNGGVAIDWSSQQQQSLSHLLNTAPFPLYQAINAAAVYPAAANDLIDSLSLMTAELMVYHMIDDMVKPTHHNGVSTSVAQPVIQRMYDALGSIRGENEHQSKLIGEQLTMQEGISRRIFQINQNIQKQVMSEDFFGNGQFSTAVLGSTANNPTGQ